MNSTNKRIFVFDTMCVNDSYTPLEINSLDLKTYIKYKDNLLKENFDIDKMKWKGEEKHEFIKDILTILQFTNYKPSNYIELVNLFELFNRVFLNNSSKKRKLIDTLKILNYNRNIMDKYSNNCKFKMLISSNIIDIDQKALNSFYTSLNLSNMILERFNDKVDFKNIKSVFEPCCGSGSLILSLQKNNMNMNITANEINIKLKIFHELFNNVDFYYCDIFE